MAVRNLLGDLSLEGTQLAILAKLSDLATAAGLTTLAGKLDVLADRLPVADGRLQVEATGTVSVANLPGTQAVSVAELPMPNGAASEDAVLEAAASSEEVVALLHAILSRLGYPDQASGSLRVLITSGTVTTVTNVSQHGGLSAIYDQHAAMLTGAATIRNQIAVS